MLNDIIIAKTGRSVCRTALGVPQSTRVYMCWPYKILDLSTATKEIAKTTIIEIRVMQKHLNT